MQHESLLKDEQAELWATIRKLRAEVKQLKQSNQDLLMALSTTVEHGDLIEFELYETNLKLRAEVVEHQRTQATLQALLEMITRKKTDLEIIVQTIVEHGDVVDNQWHQKLREATMLATCDSLTQISNRLKFDQHLHQQWLQTLKEQAPLSVLLCDIDYFKQYNDLYGHPAGDECLRQVARALYETLSRPSDLVARYGGEEFAAILPQTTEQGALRLAERMQRAIAYLRIPHQASLVNPMITLSIGVACTIPCPQQSPDMLVARADRMLYAAKQQGRNRIVYAADHPLKGPEAEV